MTTHETFSPSRFEQSIDWELLGRIKKAKDLIETKTDKEVKSKYINAKKK